MNTILPLGVCAIFLWVLNRRGTLMDLSDAAKGKKINQAQNKWIFYIAGKEAGEGPCRLPRKTLVDLWQLCHTPKVLLILDFIFTHGSSLLITFPQQLCEWCNLKRNYGYWLFSFVIIQIFLHQLYFLIHSKVNSYIFPVSQLKNF